MCNKVTIGSLLKTGYDILKKAEIDSYQLDCQLLLAKVLNKDRIFIITNRDMEVEHFQASEYIRLINLRKEKMPVKYILGWCDFFGRSFIVRQGVLIPRPDTEVLVEAALSHIKDKQYKQICDVCCGSGIIGITIASECPSVNVLSLDISDTALGVTKENVSIMKLVGRVSAINSDLLSYPLNNNMKFDVVISNPPYIKSEEIQGLMEDVKNYEPYLALSGGDDGLDFYREITSQAVRVLKPKGMLAFEIGCDQKNDVSTIMMDYGFVDVEAYSDLAGRDRVVLGFMQDNIIS